MKRPRILLVTIHGCRMPGGGGDVRAHFFARAAAGLGSVTLLSLCGGLGQQPDSAISGLCEAVIAVPDGSGGQVTQSKSSGSGLKLLLAPWRDRWRPFVAACVQHGLAVPAGLRRAMFTALLRWEHQCCCLLGLLPPLKCLAWWQEYDRLREQVLLAEAQAGGFDAVWVEDVFSWPFAADLLKTLKRPPVAVICNTYNIETVLALRQAGTIAGYAERRLAFRNASQLRRMERQAYAESSLTIVCSEQDRAEGTKLVPAGRFTVVENGVDLQYFQRGCSRPAVTESPVLLLTGTFTYGPNTEAARFFAAEILPMIRRQIPQVRFLLAGRSAQLAQQHLRSLGLHVEAVSDPADMRPIFESAAVFVVPLLVGGGTRLKILEAMAMQVPVVSTTIGAEGLNAVNGVHLQIADRPQDFAESCLRLLTAGAAEQQVETALQWVRSRYGWTALCRKAASAVEVVLDQ